MSGQRVISFINPSETPPPVHIIVYLCLGRPKQQHLAAVFDSRWHGKVWNGYAWRADIITVARGAGTMREV